MRREGVASIEEASSLSVASERSSACTVNTPLKLLRLKSPESDTVSREVSAQAGAASACHARRSRADDRSAVTSTTSSGSRPVGASRSGNGSRSMAGDSRGEALERSAEEGELSQRWRMAIRSGDGSMGVTSSDSDADVVSSEVLRVGGEGAWSLSSSASGDTERGWTAGVVGEVSDEAGEVDRLDSGRPWSSGPSVAGPDSRARTAWEI
mmetsp:Transcript_29496/g.69300  ORF Transcript_29496/g.69300 Transcript_29496/m.69300 type:complete len:210 (+) Transcript_29496:581-1210(+)